MTDKTLHEVHTIVCPHCGKPITLNLKPERVRLPSDWRERVQEREKGNSE